MSTFTKQDALDYHSMGRPGKIEVVPTKPHSTQRDLSLAYSPGVAQPCLEIQKDPDAIYKYTAKGNLVAVISNGTAVLGLGDIGTGAGKPVMEGKGLLFKIFADIDVFDIEIETKDVDKFVETVTQIATTFGGINLEDIKAPECFEIEERLKSALSIPVMHDDQHGTAMISAAGLVNALELAEKKIGDVKIVINGAGASAMACTRLYISLGANPKNVVMLDSKGVINKTRTDLNKYKKDFITDREINTLEEAMKDADVFVGLSTKDVLSGQMVKSMADNPIVFAMANPDPEIAYDKAVAARPDVIFATGRSDYPNQVNNVLGFPFIFRGALDVKASSINEEMKVAAVNAIAALAKEAVPESVNKAYNQQNLRFGREYIIPKPIDPRLITWVAPAVAKAAMESGVAREPITDWELYKTQLNERLGLDNRLLRTLQEKALNNKGKVVFAEGNHLTILKAAQVVVNEGYAQPIILGNPVEIQGILDKNQLEVPGLIIIDPASPDLIETRLRYAQAFFEKRKRKGVTLYEAMEKMLLRPYFAAMMVEMGEADVYICGYATKYSDALRPAIESIGTMHPNGHLAGLYLMITKKGPYFFSDTTVNYDPSSDILVENTILTAQTVRKFDVEPVIAMVSYSNFGSSHQDSPQRVKEAVRILHKEHPELLVDGEMQANFAFNAELRQKKFGFSKLGGNKVNTIIFPNLSSGNMAYKMLQEIGGAEAIGPILMGMAKAVQIIPLECSVREIVNLVAYGVVDAADKNVQIAGH